MSGDQTLAAYVGAFVDELAKSGLRHAVVSPGSRSTPLALALEAHPDLRVWLHVDERSAGYFALGLAKAEGKPAALLCTSGTAAANYFPAVVEAKLARVPLVVLTADRPHELRDVGAPQAIDQLGMFGTHVKWFTEMAIPDAGVSLLRYIRATACRAVAVAGGGPMGPVHLNFPFREPLVPDLSSPDWYQKGERAAAYIQVVEEPRQVSRKEANRLAEVCSGKRGLIVCGPQDDPQLPDALEELAGATGFPVLADPLSGLRRAGQGEAVLDGYDAFLRAPEARTSLVPEVVLRFGAMPVSKTLTQYLTAYAEVPQMVVDSGEGWRDPALVAAGMIYADPVSLARKVAAAIKEPAPDAWFRTWRKLNQSARETMEREREREELSEGRVIPELVDLLPEGSLLFVGNSMPVRDLDSFFLRPGKTLRTLANRGANGIDGVVSTALGASVAHDRTVLVVGDLSFYHDLNGLLAAKLHRLDVTVVVIHNDGGGIFSYLPQAQGDPGSFERLFGTPIGLDYEPAVRMFGGVFSRVESWGAFREAVGRSLEQGGFHVVEVPTDRAANVTMHRERWDQVAADVGRFFREEGSRWS
ncbi:2-succinyl-5-enolpyruvyl-6-hydroxy-3-cyclohexene-1-carboxylic-acid synthase [Desmospora profundinema]|uniref:2-succinyl-5-enolpyruvyl-6-hydroxy-3-cyclohexene-1-carboxylate synthase n=1 Tax=Desmospora profundinema TaxID=1571184 RepID=A0ABU1IPQ1_9BACL|nr:2-succinyl-5-enolpyruvyl-6-hydroxy-3-cyclohexene-1-carboxylic-acid synthase [Desmospora profundinema]MDR6226718.1 2-succinyl-5-enolpyruvyl-6-hydroxy-3-cyclohexene-1-carboxylate synthase [Desmospora profundinema]